MGTLGKVEFQQEFEISQKEFIHFFRDFKLRKKFFFLNFLFKLSLNSTLFLETFFFQIQNQYFLLKTESIFFVKDNF